jgi:hypothetical protein
MTDDSYCRSDASTSSYMQILFYFGKQSVSLPFLCSANRRNLKLRNPFTKNVGILTLFTANVLIMCRSCSGVSGNIAVESPVFNR